MKKFGGLVFDFFSIRVQKNLPCMSRLQIDWMSFEKSEPTDGLKGYMRFKISISLSQRFLKVCTRYMVLS